MINAINLISCNKNLHPDRSKTSLNPNLRASLNIKGSLDYAISVRLPQRVVVFCSLVYLSLRLVTPSSRLPTPRSAALDPVSETEAARTRNAPRSLKPESFDTSSAECDAGLARPTPPHRQRPLSSQNTEP